MKYCVHWYSHADKPNEIIAMNVTSPKSSLQQNSVFDCYNQKIPTNLNKHDMYIGGKTSAKNLYITLQQEQQKSVIERASIRPFHSESTVYKLRL